MAGMQLGRLLRQLRQAIQPAAGAEGTDAQLLDRFVRCADEDAFTLLVERRGPMVFAVCRQVLGDAHDAEDAFQATFLVLARKAASVRQGESLAGWLHRVAYHTALRVRALTAQRQQHERQAREMAAPDLISEAEWRELRPVLHQEVQRLPGKFRDPVILCYLEGKTNEEAASELGWPIGTVKGRLAQARDMLRARLTRRGLALSAAVFATEGSRALALESVPSLLTKTTVGACLHFAHDATAAGAVPASVRTLAEGTLNAMFYAKVKVGVLAAAALLLLGTIAGGLIHALHLEPWDAVGESNTWAADTAPAEGQWKDLFGEDLPPHALARLGTVRFRAGGDSVALSPDGKVAATHGRMQQKIYLWDADSGRKLREIDIRFVRHLAFSADGKKLAVCSSNEVGLWDVASGAFDAGIPVNVRFGTDFVALARDGRTALVVGTRDALAVLIDIASKKELARVEKLPERAECFAASADNALLVAWAPDQAVHGWDVRAGKEAWQRPKRGAPAALAFAPNDKRLLMADNEYRVDPPKEGKPAQVVMLRSELWLLDGTTGNEIRRTQAPKEGLAFAAFGPDGKTLIAAGRDGQAHIHETDTGKELRRFPAKVHAMQLSCSLSLDGRKLASAGPGHIVRVWDVTEGKSLGELAGHQGGVLNLAISTDGRFVATAGQDRTVRVWNSQTGKEIGQFDGELSFGYALAISPDNKFLAGYDATNTLFVWDFATRKVVSRIETTAWGHPAFSSDSRRLIIADCDNVIAWDVVEGKEISRFAKSHNNGNHVLSPDGSRLAIAPAKAQHVSVWDTATQREIRKLPSDASVARLAFSADGKLLAFAQHLTATTHIWDLETNREVRVIKRPSGVVKGMAFSPDGKTLAWGEGNALSRSHVYICELATGQIRMTWMAHERGIQCLAFASDSQRLVTGSDDTTAVVWGVNGLRDARTDKPTAAELDRLWQELGGDAEPALHAMGRLQASGSAVALFEARVRPAATVDKTRIDTLIADLGSSKLEVRAQASAELEKLEEGAEGALRKVLDSKPSLVLTQRVEGLLKLLERPGADSLRMLRAIEVLEHVGTPEAKAVLDTLAKGAAGARRTREAAASLERLKPTNPTR